jgi:hypothetical protein
MDKIEVDKTGPLRVAQLLALDGGGAAWRADELAAILRHQLDAHLAADLGEMPRRSEEVSFAQLLSEPNPPLELLERVKRFGKAHKSTPDGALPAEVATVLYFASIVAARLRCGARISELEDAALLEGMEWALAQTWLDERCAHLFREGLAALKSMISTTDSEMA